MAESGLVPRAPQPIPTVEQWLRTLGVPERGRDVSRERIVRWLHHGAEFYDRERPWEYHCTVAAMRELARWIGATS